MCNFCTIVEGHNFISCGVARSIWMFISTTCASSHGYQNYLFEGCMLMMRLDCVVCTSKLCLRFSTTIDYGITRLSNSGFVFYAQYGVKRHIQCFEWIYNVSSPY